MVSKKFIYIWEYSVKEEHQTDFIHTYGSSGAWLALFKKAQGYIKTELYRDDKKPSRFITIDYWQSKSERDAFRIKFSKEFEQLDQICEGFTEDEKWVGDFEQP